MKAQMSTTKSLKIFVIVVLLSLFIIPEVTFAHGKPPKWAPAKGYRAKTRHIYFPDHNFYYDIQTNHYLYLNNGNWSVSVAIPRPFISVNLSRAVQIQLDFAGSTPYRYNRDHCTRYKKVKVYKPRRTAVIVKEKHDHDDKRHGNKHGKRKGKKHHGDD